MKSQNMKDQSTRDLVNKFSRFFFAGLFSTGLNLVLLYVFVQRLGLWYLLASAIAFIISVATHFFLQRLWVFAHAHGGPAHSVTRQFSGFTALALINLALNSLLMYVFVSMFGMNYLVSQTVIRILLACLNYVAYDRLVFKRPHTPII
jgi:putative flippase GtrA